MLGCRYSESQAGRQPASRPGSEAWMRGARNLDGMSPGSCTWSPARMKCHVMTRHLIIMLYDMNMESCGIMPYRLRALLLTLPFIHFSTKQ